MWELVASLDADAAPEDKARADCFSYYTIADDGPVFTSQELAQNADAIVTGTVASLGPGFWDSRRAAGHPPTGG